MYEVCVQKERGVDFFFNSLISYAPARHFFVVVYYYVYLFLKAELYSFMSLMCTMAAATRD